MRGLWKAALALAPLVSAIVLPDAWAVDEIDDDVLDLADLVSQSIESEISMLNPPIEWSANVK